jgi:hypothetical protein
VATSYHLDQKTVVQCRACHYLGLIVENIMHRWPGFHFNLYRKDMINNKPVLHLRVSKVSRAAVSFIATADVAKQPSRIMNAKCFYASAAHAGAIL